MSSNCFEDGNNGQNTRTCATADGGGGSSGGGSSAEKGVMLFGVRLTTEGSFRKTVSMNNLCQYDHQPQDSNADAGYASDDVVHASGRSRERKRGIPWTEEEHKLFLLGLQKVGKGDWRGISRNYVKTRTPTQVASHAQKYFLRRSNQNRRRRSRNSLFDITTDTLMGSPMEEDQTHHVSVAVPQPPQPPPHLTQPLTRNISGYYPASTYPAALLPVTGGSSKDNLLLGQRVNQQTAPFHPRVVRPVPMLPVPPSSRISDLNLNRKPSSKAQVEPNLPLSLKLSSPSSSDDQPPTSSSAFQAMSSGDSIISVA